MARTTGRSGFKLKSGNNTKGSSFKMMGSSSPAKRTGRWVVDPTTGEKVQTGEYDIIEKEKEYDAALLEAEMSGEGGRNVMGSATAEEKAVTEGLYKEAKKVKPEVLLTGQERLDELTSGMTAAELKQFEGVGHEGYLKKYPDLKEGVLTAIEEAKTEKKSGVAEKQIALDRQAIVDAKAKKNNQ